MDRIDWDAVKMYGGYALWAITLIAGAFLSVRRERRESARDQRDQATASRADLNTRRTSSGLVIPNEQEIKQYGESLQKLSEGPRRFTETLDKTLSDMSRAVMVSGDFVHNYICKDLPDQTNEPADVEDRRKLRVGYAEMQRAGQETLDAFEHARATIATLTATDRKTLTDRYLEAFENLAVATRPIVAGYIELASNWLQRLGDYYEP